MNNEVITMKTGWSEVTLDELIQIDQIRQADIPIDMKALNIVSVLCNRSVEWLENQRIGLVSKLTHMIDFLAEDIVPEELKEEYILNGHSYKLDCDISSITTAKYIDYQNYMKEDPVDKTKVASIWLVPSGHEYNDGYDVGKTIEDMGSILVPDYMAIVNFLTRQLAAFILVSADCLKPDRKTLKTMSRAKKLEMEGLIAQLHNMAYSLWCLGCAKKL